MKNLIKFLMVAGLLCLPAISQAQVPRVVISEVGWAGSSVNISDEWLELTNLSSATVDLTGWSIAGAATGGVALSLPAGSQILPKSTYLISNYDHQDEKSALAVASHFTTSSLSLSNSGLGLVLKNAAGTGIDSAGDGGAPMAGGIEEYGEGDDAGERSVSMVRLAAGLNGATPAAWINATQSFGFDTATADLGTPGILNLVIPDESELEEEIDESTTLFINEIVSDPVEGQEEFIEIYNPGDTAVNLSGWSVQDASAKSTLLPESELAAHSYYVIWSPRGILNNGGDQIELMNPDGAVIDYLEYGTPDVPAVHDPNALAKNPDGQFVPTGTPTPGAANIISAERDPEPVVEPEPEPEPDSNPETDDTSLLINEIVSDPVEGQQEFIELYNAGRQAVNLAGWSVRDAALKVTLLPEAELAASSYYVIWSPRGILNNGGDTVELLDPDGRLVDSLIYGTEAIPAVADPNALARDPNGQFVPTGTSTPGAANIINAEADAPAPAATVQDEPPETPAEPAPATESETQTQIPETENDPAPVAYTLVLSEIYANTLGDDATEEFIEIQNTGLESIDLQGIMLEDEGGKQYLQTDFYRLAAGAYYALPRTLTKITLNNDGDLIRLFAPDNSLLDEQTYAKANQGQSFARRELAWAWTSQVTPNEPNRFSTNEVYAQPAQPTVAAAPASASSSRVSVSANAVRRVSLAEAKLLSDNARISLTGIVSVEPEILGKQIMYISDQQSGIQIYKYDSQFPELSVGDEVQIVGTMSTSHGERRVKITADGSISLIGSATEPSAISISPAAFTDAYVGRLVAITGTVLSRSGSLVLLESNEQEVQLRLASLTDIEPSIFESGASVSVTGILTSYDGTFRLSPRSASDIQVLKSPVADQEAAALAGKIEAENNQQGWGTFLAVITLLTIGGLALRQLIHRMKRLYADRRPLSASAQKAG
ncbi:lamin tail domain-containing protein [Patescibacteria group bacterium]|nr:lamin tail domain-containing protein [Patescibacteria group bacterium]